jgi:hypothetical protein
MPKSGNTQVPSGGGPSEDFYAITPSDSVALATAIRGIYVGGAGDVSVQNAAGTAVVFKAVPVGSVLPVSTTRVNATLTTATLLIGLV